jgi:hypothetical protein
MMELAVVVVFDNPGALTIGPVEQGEPAFNGERHAQWILMRRRHERERGVRRAAGRRSNVEPPIVNSDAHESKLSLLQQIAREDISGVLDPNLGAGLEQGLCDHAKGPLEAGSDQDLIGGTCDIPRDPQVARNCEPQRLVTHYIVQIGIDHLLVIELTRHPHSDLRP